MARKEDIYDEELSPLLKQIIAICKEHEIGLAVSFELDNDGTEEAPRYLYCTTALPGDESSLHLARVRALAPKSLQGPRRP